MRKSVITPDRWIVVTLSSPKYGDVDKVLASWSGGYLHGDSWKLNSGISSVEETPDYYDFHGTSGSVYRCYKQSYGLSGVSAGILKQLEESGFVSGVDKYANLAN